MLVSEIISRTRLIAGDTDSIQFSDADLMAWINDGMRECALDNQLLQKKATSTVVNGTNEYVLPTDILKIHSIRYDGSKLPVMDMQEAEQNYDISTITDKGTPVVSYVWAGMLTLYPAPDNSVMKLDVNYTRTPLAITLVGDTPELPVVYHRRLIDYCLAIVAEQDDDINKYNMKMQEFKSGVANLKDLPEWTYDLYPSMSYTDD